MRTEEEINQEANICDNEMKKKSIYRHAILSLRNYNDDELQIWIKAIEWLNNQKKGDNR